MIAAVLAAAPSAAFASDLVLTVKDNAGAPVKNAVVTVYPAAGLPKTPIKFPWSYSISQKNIEFDPFVLIVPVGAEVSFPNLDKVRHHVYSFSSGNKFQLPLYGQEQTRTVSSKNAGVVALGCNIHDQMAAFVQVVDTPYAIKTGADGVADIANLPAGAAKVTVWQPFMHAPKNEVTMNITIPGQGEARQNVGVDMRPPPQGLSIAD